MQMEDTSHRVSERIGAGTCRALGCPYDDEAYSSDPDGLCLNCSDDRRREGEELASELRQDAAGWSN